MNLCFHCHPVHCCMWDKHLANGAVCEMCGGTQWGVKACFHTNATRQARGFVSDKEKITAARTAIRRENDVERSTPPVEHPSVTKEKTYPMNESVQRSTSGEEGEQDKSNPFNEIVNRNW